MRGFMSVGTLGHSASPVSRGGLDRIPATSATTRSRSSLTTTTSNSPARASSSAAAARRASSVGRRLGAPPDEAPAQLRRRRRLHEHEHRLRELPLDPERPLHVDLEQHVDPGGEPLLDRAPGGALQLAEHLEPLQEAIGVAHLTKPSGRDEVVVDPVHLGRAPRPSRVGHRRPQGRDPLQQLLGDGALADARRAGEHEQHDSPVSEIRRASQALRMILGWREETFALVPPEPAEPSTLADLELHHDPPRLHLADPRERFEHAHDLQLRERVVVGGLVEQLAETQRTRLELRLDLGARSARFGRLLQRSLTLLGGERRGQWHPATSGTTAAASIRSKSRLTTGSGRPPDERVGHRARNLNGRVFGVVGAGHRAPITSQSAPRMIASPGVSTRA